MGWFSTYRKESQKEYYDRLELEFKVRNPVIAAYCEKKGLSYRVETHRLFDLLAAMINDIEGKA